MADYSIEELARIVTPIAKKYGVERVYLFGSRARGDNSAESDYDFSIDPGEIDNILVFFSFIDDLEEALDSKVDVINRKSLKNDNFYKFMTSDEVVVYG